MELVVHRLAMTIGLPERPLGRGLGHRIPAAERALDVRRQVLVLQQEGDEFLRALLVFRAIEDHARLDRGAIDHLRAVGLVGEAGGRDQLGVVLLRCSPLVGRQRFVVHVVEPLRSDRNGRIVGHDDRLIVEGNVVVGILPARRRRRGAALGVDAGVVGHRTDQALLHLGIVDQQLAVVVDQLDVVGVHEGQERVERVARIDAHREAGRIVPRPRFFPVRRLDLIAPERPVLVPGLGNVRFLEARLAQHVDPVLDVHGLLLERERVVRALLGLVVVQIGRLDGVRQEVCLHRREDVGQVLELAIERPLAGNLEVVHVGVRDVGRRAGVERRDGLGDHVLGGVLRELDLDFGLVLELLDRRKEGVVLGLVEALDPPHGEGLLRQRLAPKCNGAAGDDAGKELIHRSPPWNDVTRNCRRPVLSGRSRQPSMGCAWSDGQRIPT